MEEEMFKDAQGREKWVRVKKQKAYLRPWRKYKKEKYIKENYWHSKHTKKNRL